MDTQTALIVYCLFLSVLLGIAVQHILELKELVKSDRKLLDTDNRLIAEQARYIAFLKELLDLQARLLYRKGITHDNAHKDSQVRQ